MGLFSFLKSQCLKVIEWTDSTSDTIAYRFEVPDRYAIMKNSQLTVRESQMAIFVVEGKIADVFGPGRYKLDDAKNIPILTKLMSWKYVWETPYTGEVYFINTKQFLNQKWGTSNPIMMEDSRFGMIRLRGFGTFGYKVKSPEKLLREQLGTKSILKTTDILEHFKKLMVSRLSDAIAESGVPALKLAMYYDEIGEIATKRIGVDFENLGLELTSVIIENLSLPENVEKQLDTKTEMNILSDGTGGLGQFTQYQAAQAIKDAAANPGNGMAGMGVGLGAGVGIGGLFANAMGDALKGNQQASQQPSQQASQQEKPKTKTCSKCGAALAPKAKFCVECGEKVGLICPECGSQNAPGAKFCVECGEKLLPKKS